MKINILILTALLSVAVFPFGSVYAQEDLPSKVTLTSSINNSPLKVGQEIPITWKTENFPANGLVNINLIKQISNSPIQYTLIGQIASSTINDGKEIWKIAKSDLGDKLSLEITCDGSTQFSNGCISTSDHKQFAVIKEGFWHNLGNIIVSFWENLFK